MKTVCEKDMCTGCKACVDACPKGALTIKDSMLSFNAVIDEKKCIDCKICEKVCQRISEAETSKTLYCLEGWSKDKKVRFAASSGGIAMELMREMLKKNGVVVSCHFTDGKFKFTSVSNSHELDKFTGSKYLKSDAQGAYKLTKKYLEEDRWVLFIGLPCQVGALKKYLPDKLKEKLVTADLICHGAPSENTFKEYCRQNGISLTDISEIQFRVKGCNNEYKDYKTIEVAGSQDKYSIAFLAGLTYTENCYDCRYAKIDRVSDITLGDSWGTSLDIGEQQKGISLMLVQSEKGMDLIKKSNIFYQNTDINQAIETNHQLKSPQVKPEARDYFLKELSKGKSFNKMTGKLCRNQSIKQSIKAVMYKLGLSKKHGKLDYGIRYKK